MSGENLLPKHRIEAWRVHRCVNKWSMGLLTLSLLVCGLIIGAFMTKARPSAMPAGLHAKIELDRSEFALVQEQIRKLRLVEAAHQRTLAVPQWEGLLDVIAREIAGDAQLKAVRTERVSGSTPSWTISIVGVTRSRQAPELLAARLEGTGLFSQVRHGFSPAQAGQQDLNFFLDCTIAPGATR